MAVQHVRIGVQGLQAAARQRVGEFAHTHRPDVIGLRLKKHQAPQSSAQGQGKGARAIITDEIFCFVQLSARESPQNCKGVRTVHVKLRQVRSQCTEQLDCVSVMKTIARHIKKPQARKLPQRRSQSHGPRMARPGPSQLQRAKKRTPRQHVCHHKHAIVAEPIVTQLQRVQKRHVLDYLGNVTGALEVKTVACPVSRGENAQNMIVIRVVVYTEP